MYDNIIECLLYAGQYLELLQQFHNVVMLIFPILNMRKLRRERFSYLPTPLIWDSNPGCLVPEPILKLLVDIPLKA